MYRKDDDPSAHHPGFQILGLGTILCAAVILAMLASRYNRGKRSDVSSENSDNIPVTSISSVTELWWHFMGDPEGEKLMPLHETSIT